MPGCFSIVKRECDSCRANILHESLASGLTLIRLADFGLLVSLQRCYKADPFPGLVT